MAENKSGKEASGQAVKGILALYADPETVLKAAEKARDAGFTKWDVFTPFPVHGMDVAMGLGKSNLPWVTFVAALAGLGSAVFIQVGAMVYSWPANYGGKPFLAWPAFVPISFEMTVLLAGLASAFAALLMGGILKRGKPAFHPDLTCHRFGVFVDASDPKYDATASRELFESAGAVEIQLVKEGA